MLPMDLTILRARLMLLWDGMRSSRHIITVCSDYCSHNASIMTECNNLGLSLGWCSKFDIKVAVWDKFVKSVGW
jgi:hypothetical protein